MARKKSIILLLLVVLITVTPLILVKNSEFGGADGQAEEIITVVNPDYEPWAENPISPPGGETESMLFAIQAAFGALIIGYGFGYFKGKAIK